MSPSAVSSTELQTILITGASGFIAAHVVEAFLTAGFKVRGSVRSDATAKKVRAAHPGFPPEQLEFAIVPDISAPGAFDEAIKGVDGVIHMASPFTFDVTDFDKELFEPAVNGTTSVLKAAKAYNPKVKRIVITSSFAAVIDPTKGERPGYNYTEADWNPQTAEEVKAEGNAVAAYVTSKTLAEHAAWDFIKSEKPGFSIATLCPPMVYGPLVTEYDSMDKLNTSSKDIWNLINGSAKEVPDTPYPVYTDVRDLAHAHLLAFTTEAAANQRYAICNDEFVFQKMVDIIREKFPELKDQTPVGHPGQYPETLKLDASKSKKELGMKYHTLEETVVDTVKSLLALKKKLDG